MGCARHTKPVQNIPSIFRLVAIPVMGEAALVPHAHLLPTAVKGALQLPHGADVRIGNRRLQPSDTTIQREKKQQGGA